MKTYMKARSQTPEHKAYMKAYMKARSQTPLPGVATRKATMNHVIPITPYEPTSHDKKLTDLAD
jgi:hypothetical protein